MSSFFLLYRVYMLNSLLKLALASSAQTSTALEWDSAFFTYGYPQQITVLWRASSFVAVRNKGNGDHKNMPNLQEGDSLKISWVTASPGLCPWCQIWLAAANHGVRFQGSRI
jgi:hypothetical protein